MEEGYGKELGGRIDENGNYWFNTKDVEYTAEYLVKAKYKALGVPEKFRPAAVKGVLKKKSDEDPWETRVGLIIGR